MKLELSTARALRDRGLLNNMFDRPENLKRLVSIGKSLHRIYEQQCNGFQDYQSNWDEQASLKADKRETRLVREAYKIANEMGAYIYFQTDPRGATLYIDSKSISANDYTNAVCLI